MKTYSCYLISTGEITGKRITSSDAMRELNTLTGEAWLLGEIDPRGQLVEFRPDDFGNATIPVVVPYQPPKPAASQFADWAWNEGAREWVYVPTLAALQRAANVPILAQLAELDAKIVRPAGEITEALALGQAVPTAAVTRLSAINAEKLAIRQFIIAISAATASTLDAVIAAGPQA